MFYKHVSALLCAALFSCYVLLPVVEAGHHGNNDNGLAVLLATGILAKVLRHHKHEEHHIHIPVPVEHHEHHGHHGHHGSGTTRYIVHHPPPFYNVHGGMMPSPSMVPRYVYSAPNPGYTVYPF